MIITARCFTILSVSLLSSCSSVNTTGPVYVRPSPPTEKAIGAAVGAIAKEAKLVTPLEISALRPNDHGPGSFFVCVREVNPPPDKPRRYYSTFLDNNEYKGSRLSVIMDRCELQTYSPAPVAAPAQPPPTPATTCQAQASPELDAMTIGLAAFSRTSGWHRIPSGFSVPGPRNCGEMQRQTKITIGEILLTLPPR
jgi:hypothetical protein